MTTATTGPWLSGGSANGPNNNVPSDSAPVGSRAWLLGFFGMGWIVRRRASLGRDITPVRHISLGTGRKVGFASRDEVVIGSLVGRIWTGHGRISLSCSPAGLPGR